MTDQVKLSREEIAQLEEANAEALEREIASLAGHRAGGSWRYREFWAHAARIHDSFRRMKPLRKSDRARLWIVFTEVRELVKSRQEQERKYSEWLTGIRREAVEGVTSEVEELLASPGKEDSDIEELIHLQEAMRLMAEGDWSGFPDTPQVSLIVHRLKTNEGGRESEEIKKTLSKLRRKVSQFLDKGAAAKISEISALIGELREKGGSPASHSRKGRAREIRNSILSPMLLRDQKEKLLKELDEALNPPGAAEGRETERELEAVEKMAETSPEGAAVPEKDEKAKPGRRKEKARVEALLDEIESAVSKKKG